MRRGLPVEREFKCCFTRVSPSTRRWLLFAFRGCQQGCTNLASWPRGSAWSKVIKFKAAPPWSFGQSRTLLEGVCRAGFATGRSRQASCMQLYLRSSQCSQCRQCSSALAEREGVRVVRSAAAFIRRALQPHGSCCAAQYGTTRYNTVRLSRKGRGQEFD